MRKIVFLALLLCLPIYGEYVQKATSWKPSVANVGALPSTGNLTGDARITNNNQAIYVWNGSSWINTGGGGGGGFTPADLTTSTTGVTVGGGSSSVNGAGTTVNVQTASGSQPGLLSAANWTTFNNKQSALTLGNLTDDGTDGIVVTSGTGAVLGSGTSVAQHVADSSHNGYLSQTDWSTFNGKQASLTIGNLTSGTTGVSVSGGTGSVIGSGTSVSVQTASGSQPGLLSAADWTTFNGKQSALTFGNLTDAGTDGITVTSGTGAIIGSGTSLAQHVADATHNGYLSSADWTTFSSGGVTIGNLDAQTANTKGLAFVSGVLSSQSADATHPGMVNTTTQSMAGNKTFTGNVTAANLQATTEGTLNAPSISEQVTGNYKSGFYFSGSGANIDGSCKGTGSDAIHCIQITTVQVGTPPLLYLNVNGALATDNVVTTGSVSDTLTIAGDEFGDLTRGGAMKCGGRSAAFGEVCKFYAAGSIYGTVASTGWTLLIADGSASAPALSFVDATTTGISEANGTDLVLSANAIAEGRFNSSGLRVGADNATQDGNDIPARTIRGANKTGTTNATTGAGGQLTIQAGSATGSTSLGNGGVLILAGGTSVGNNPGQIQFQTAGTTRAILSGAIGFFALQTVGAGFRVKEGTNAKQGVATLVGGTVTVSNTSVTAASRIFVTPQNVSGVGSVTAIGVSARSVGTSFTITSANVLDTSDVAWEMFEGS